MSSPQSAAKLGRGSERSVVFLIGAISFVNVLDFVMVMPLGPDFADALGIDVSLVGLIGGSYTLAAGLSGILGSFFLERFDRRIALGVAMLGLVVGTAAGGWAQGLHSLLAARVLAGAFGGPATSLSLAIIADVVPPERRGRAFGAVMGAFSIASVLGVPAGLWLAEHGGWRLPFFAVAGLGLLVAIAAVSLLPSLRGHLPAYLASRHQKAPPLLTQGHVLLSYLMTAVTMASGFMLIPNISAYVQGNLGFPRSRLEELYFFGGIASFFTMRLAGSLVDRYGSFWVGLGGSMMLIVCVYFGFYDYLEGVPLPLFFMGFTTAMGLRNVAYNTLTSKVPRPAERARFMSFQSAVQHFASAGGAFLSAQLLSVGPNGRLMGMQHVALGSMALTSLLPLLLSRVEKVLHARAAPPSVPPPPEVV